MVVASCSADRIRPPLTPQNPVPTVDCGAPISYTRFTWIPPADLQVQQARPLLPESRFLTAKLKAPAAVVV